MQTTILFKTDKKLKKEAQDIAKSMGIPFSAILNRMMEQFVAQKEITFSNKPLIPTPYLKRILDQGERDFKAGKVETYGSLEELRAALEK